MAAVPELNLVLALPSGCSSTSWCNVIMLTLTPFSAWRTLATSLGGLTPVRVDLPEVSTHSWSRGQFSFASCATYIQLISFLFIEISILHQYRKSHFTCWCHWESTRRRRVSLVSVIVLRSGLLADTPAACCWTLLIKTWLVTQLGATPWRILQFTFFFFALANDRQL